MGMVCDMDQMVMCLAVAFKAWYVCVPKYADAYGQQADYQDAFSNIHNAPPLSHPTSVAQIP